MLFNVRHFLYNQMKEIIEQRNERLYWIKHFLELLAMYITLIRGCLGIFTYLLNIQMFPYWLQDPLVFFFYEYNQKGFVFMTLIVLTPLIHGMMGAYAFFFQPANSITNHLCYDLIVVNLDQLNNCQVSQHQQNVLLNREFQFNLNQLKQNFVWSIPPIRFILKQFCWHWTKFQLIFSIKMQTGEILKYKMKLIPNHPIRLRQVLAKTVIVFDLIIYIWHCVIGNNFFNLI